MSVTLIMVAGVCALALAFAWWMFKRPSTKSATPSQMARKSAQSARTAAAAKPAAAAVAPPEPAPEPEPPIEVPDELATFHWREIEEIDEDKRNTLLDALKGIPRPPPSLQKLLSPEFVARAGSMELSELIMGEPLIAAKVLSTVNSPLYGLRKPVTGIGQAVTFLGMTTVRNICMQYMVAEAFKPRLAASQKTFDNIWRASTIASELCARLSKALNLPDHGSLSTQVVLSFVGHLSAASLLPAKAQENWLALSRLERARREQEFMEVGAGEVGTLLMTSWGLPQSLIDNVREIDRVLITPPAEQPTVDGSRKALSFMCARLGELLAQGGLPSLKGYDIFQDMGIDTFYLNQHLRNPFLKLLPSIMASSEFQDAMAPMLKNGTGKTT